MSEVQIMVNGAAKVVQLADSIDYDTVVKLAGKVGSHYTVVCCYRELQSRSLRPGQQVPLVDGMFLNVAYTGNA